MVYAPRIPGGHCHRRPDAFRRPPCHRAAPSRHRRACVEDAVPPVARPAGRAAAGGRPGVEGRRLFADDRAGRGHSHGGSRRDRGRDRLALPQSRTGPLVRRSASVDRRSGAPSRATDRRRMDRIDPAPADPYPRLPAPPPRSFARGRSGARPARGAGPRLAAARRSDPRRVGRCRSWRTAGDRRARTAGAARR